MIGMSAKADVLRSLCCFWTSLQKAGVMRGVLLSVVRAVASEEIERAKEKSHVVERVAAVWIEAVHVGHAEGGQGQTGLGKGRCQRILRAAVRKTMTAAANAKTSRIPSLHRPGVRTRHTAPKSKLGTPSL